MPSKAGGESPKALVESLQHVSIETERQGLGKKGAAAPEVAESWEDEQEDGAAEADSPDAGDEPSFQSPIRLSKTEPHAPKRNAEASQIIYSPDGTPLTGVSAPPNTPFGRGNSRRPEKTVGPAARMIAGALGVKAPKRTEEQRAYDQALREKERMARESKKRGEEESMKAREKIWDD